jgi:hypothetical protein
MTETMAVRRRREIEFLARELFGQAQGLMTAIGDLVPAELAAGGGELADGAPLRAVADQLDDALRCFDLLQEELGLPAGAGPRYGRFLRGARPAGAPATTPTCTGRRAAEFSGLSDMTQLDSMSVPT